MQFDPSKHYQGSRCKHGHQGIRFKANQTCVECARAHSKKHYSENKDSCIATTRRWQSNHPEESKRIKKDCNAKNPYRSRERAHEWRLDNKEQFKKQMVVVQSRRRAKKKQAVPAWVDESLIKTVYEKARGLGGHVDHIVPLSSKLVCGLHCWDNLQILPPEMNQIKNNSEWPDMP